MDLGTDFIEVIHKFDTHTTEEFWYPEEATFLFKVFKRQTKDKLTESELGFIEFEAKLIGGEVWSEILKRYIGDPFVNYWPYSEANKEYAKFRLEQSSQILHKARYAYYLWCKTKDHNMALESAKYFRNAALQHQLADPEKYYKQVEFCFEIALKIYRMLGGGYRNKGLDIAKEIFSVLKKEFEEQKIMGLFLSKVLVLLDALDFSLDSSTERTIIAKDMYTILEKCGTYHADKGNLYLERSCIEKQIELLKYGAVGNKEDLNKKIVISLEREGDRGYPFIGLSFYESAIRYLTENSMNWPEKRNELETKLSKAKQDSIPYYKTVSTSVTIPDEAIDQALSDFSILTPKVALENFLNSDNYVPSLASAQSNANEIAIDAPVYSLFKKKVSTDGLSSSAIESKEYEVNSQFSLMCQLNENFFVNKICEMEFFNKEYLIAWINQSANFDEKNKELILEAINEYCESRFICSGQLLTLRIEPSIRRIARLAGIAPKKIKSETQDIFDAQLGGLLTDEKIEAVLGKDFATYLKVKFSNPYHQNYRNKVGHGYITKADLNKSFSNAVLFVLLKLAKIQVGPS